MSGLSREVLDEVDQLASLPNWSAHDLRPETRRLLEDMPCEAVQCALALARAGGCDRSASLAHRARVVLACHGHGDPFSEVLSGAVILGLGQLAYAD